MSGESRAVQTARRVAADPVYGAPVVAREIENAALASVDRAAAERVTGIDRRFDRRVRELRDQLRTREAELPEHPAVGGRDGLEALAFLLAAFGFGVAMTALSRALAPDVAVWTAAGLVLAATVLHGANAARTRSDAASRHAGSYRLISAGAAAAAAVAGFALVPDAPLAPLVIAACAVACAALGALAIVRWLPVGRGIAAHRVAFTAMMSDLGAVLEEAATEATAEFDGVIEALGEPERAAFAAERESGMAAFARREDASSVGGFDRRAPIGRQRYFAVEL